MKTIKTLLLSVALFVGILSPVALPSVAYADAKTGIETGIEATGQSGGTDMEGFIANIINILLFLIGALSVVMIIYGGIRYVISGGDSGQVTSAKNTIMYAVVGLVVAILAYAIVNFVVGQL